MKKNPSNGEIWTLSLPKSCRVLLLCCKHTKPSPSVTLPDSVTLDNIEETVQSYHETTVQPSFEILNKQIRQEDISRLERSELGNFLGSQTLNAIESAATTIRHHLQYPPIFQCPAFHRTCPTSSNNRGSPTRTSNPLAITNLCLPSYHILTRKLQ